MENTAKNFALQLGSLISLYVSVTALITLLFGVITAQYPDVAQGSWEYESAASSIRLGIALLVVFFPTYIVLTRLVNNVRRREHGTYLALTKWLIYLSLLIGGAALLGDLVVTINSFLTGELTIRFILKALVFLCVVGAAFVYYLLDARGYWAAHEKHSIQYAVGIALVVVGSLAMGVLNTETPAQVREMKIDEQQIVDLTNIQARVEAYYSLNAKLPGSLDDVYTETEAPTASDERGAYEYNRKTETSFELCADFAFPTSKAQQEQYSQPYYDTEGMIIKNPYNWDHKGGVTCFERVINVAQPLNVKLNQKI